MDSYELALMLYKALSSSPTAIAQMISGIIQRLEQNASALDERAEFEEMIRLAQSIACPAKAKTLLQCIDICFRELRKRGAEKKALIFTDNRATQQFLY